jgi:tRNA1(Val) A37 N6-methylase TrmN6
MDCNIQEKDEEENHTFPIIKRITRENYVQKFDVTKEDKLKYGEIYTPFSLIDQMFSLLTNDLFKDKTKKWLDTGAGSGFFSIYLYWKLMEGLKDSIKDTDERHDHIIKNMIYMIELKETNVNHLINVFGKESNIICADYIYDSLSVPVFDYIIGNPPYNSGGIKKVPSNVLKNKTEDGKTIWKSFLTKSLSLLKKDTGKLLYIIPSIWMKPDKYMIHSLLTSYQLEKLHCLSNTETNKYFKGEAQTPTCFFLLTNMPTSDYCVDLYDTDKNDYVKYSYNNKLPVSNMQLPVSNMQLPVFGASVVKKLLQFCNQYGNISDLVKKTNCPSKDSLFSPFQSPEYPYKNIKTCVLDKEEGLTPTLVVEYSNKPQAFHGKSKIVMAHKMYGFPFLDSDGEYGISSRDNYVLCNQDYSTLNTLRFYLSTQMALYLFESTRYRMKYLEKYAFVFIPNIMNSKELVSKILFELKDQQSLSTAIMKKLNEIVMDYFNLDDVEKKSVLTLHKKMYKSFAVN